MNISKIVNKNTLLKAGALGVGSLAAEVVTSKVAPMVLKTEESQKIAPAIPLLVGLLLNSSKGKLASVGDGMLAESVKGFAKTFLPESAKTSLGISENVMLAENVMLDSSITPVGGSNSFDFTNEGEMDY